MLVTTHREMLVVAVRERGVELYRRHLPLAKLWDASPPNISTSAVWGSNRIRLFIR